MIKSIKIRLYPNNKQITKLFQYAGCARFAYNWAIAKEQENYKQKNKFLSDNELRKEFTQLKKLPEYRWLNEVSNNVTKQAINANIAARFPRSAPIVRTSKRLSEIILFVSNTS